MTTTCGDVAGQSGIFKLIEGLKPVSASALAEYEREMADAIPVIAEAVRRRQVLAAESRQRVMAHPSTIKKVKP